MKKILITGITGFAGSFLAESFIETGDYSISGTYLSETSLSNVSLIKEKLCLSQVDLTNSEHVERFIATERPDIIFHLAALPSPSQSFEKPSEFLFNNITAELAILEAVRKAKLAKTRILIVSSAEVYGLITNKDLPVGEETPLRPVSPYGVSKIAQDFLGLQYYLSYHLPIIRVRPFNHAGPRLSPHFAPSAFAKKIAEIEKGKREPILMVGNLSAKRDFTDVRDMVLAYRMLIEKGQEGEVYNIGSGVSLKISDILEKLLSFSRKKITVTVDEKLLRLNDVPDLVCDYRKFHELSGWKPTIPIDQTLKDTLEYWRSII